MGIWYKNNSCEFVKLQSSIRVASSMGIWYKNISYEFVELQSSIRVASSMGIWYKNNSCEFVKLQSSKSDSRPFVWRPPWAFGTKTIRVNL
jgi:hypothetical protein